MYLAWDRQISSSAAECADRARADVSAPSTVAPLLLKTIGASVTNFCLESM
jgi:hypothetical protein